MQWSSFPEHLLGLFRDLSTDKHFADVTLISEDQVRTPAHKVVLSACSPVLRSLLLQHCHAHPVLCLTGTKQSELQALLKFMYCGEARVCENRFDEFVSVANDLEVRGIMVDQAADTIDEEMDIKEEKLLDSEDSSAEVELRPEPVEVSCDLPVQTVKPRSGRTRGPDKKPRKVTPGARQTGVLKRGSRYGQFPCPECDAIFTRFDNLSKHRRTKHEGVLFFCDECDYQSTRKDNVSRHKITKVLPTNIGAGENRNKTETFLRSLGNRCYAPAHSTRA